MFPRELKVERWVVLLPFRPTPIFLQQLTNHLYSQGCEQSKNVESFVLFLPIIQFQLDSGHPFFDLPHQCMVSGVPQVFADCSE